MLKWIITSSMKIRIVVVAIAILIIYFGFGQLTSAPIDILPEFSRPYVQIHTEALGLSAAEVEALITTPLEADMLNGVSWVDEIRSESITGLSSIVLIFEPGTDIMAARQMVQERLVSVFALPNVSKAPVMLNPMSSTSRCMMVGLKSKKLSKIDVSVLARWTIVPRLMGVPGVANVAIWGYRDRQLQVQVDPKQLQKNNLTLNQIISTTGNALWVSPLSFLNASTPGTGGFFDTPNQRLGIRHILPITTPEELSKVTIEGSKATLGEVSDIVEEHQPLIGDALVDETPNLILIVEKFPWANTVEVTKGVESALQHLQPGLADLEINSSLFRPATFIGVAVENITEVILYAGLLIVLALILFFYNWRFALIGFLSITLSILIGLEILYLQGITINLMILAGLVIALGVIIDDVITDVENLMTQLKNQDSGSNKSIPKIILEASLEMRTSLLYALAILLLIALPLFLLKGIAGAFYQSIAWEYLLAMVASFVVAITLTPALTYLFFKNSKSIKSSGNIFTNFLQKLYDKVFLSILKFTRPIFVMICALVLLSGLGFLFLKPGSLIPEFKENDLMVRWEASPGTSRIEMNRILGLAGNELGEIDGVKSVSAHVGRAVMSDMITNVNTGQLWINVKPDVNYEKMIDDIKAVINGYPGFFHEVLTYTQSKVREELAGNDESLIIRIYGEDIGIVQKEAEKLNTALQKIDGITESRIIYPEMEPTIEIEVNLESAKRFGLKPGDVRRQATSLISGLAVGNLFEQQKVFDVVVWGKPSIRHNLSSIENLLIETPINSRVPLKEVADIRIVPNPTNIKRESVARYIDIAAAVNGRDLSNIIDDVKERISSANFPLEYRAELLGEFAQRVDAQQQIKIFTLATFILIFLLFQSAFKSWKLALAIFLTIPMALIGGIIFNFIVFGDELSIGALIGFITLFGIVVRNTIILVRRYHSLEEFNSGTFSASLIEKGTRERFSPIIITAFILVLTFLPMVMFGKIAGLEMIHSISVIVLGGIITTTIYSVIAVPVLYNLFGSEKEPDLELEKDVAIFNE